MVVSLLHGNSCWFRRCGLAASRTASPGVCELLSCDVGPRQRAYLVRLLSSRLARSTCGVRARLSWSCLVMVPQSVHRCGKLKVRWSMCFEWKSVRPPAKQILLMLQPKASKMRDECKLRTSLHLSRGIPRLAANTMEGMLLMLVVLQRFWCIVGVCTPLGLDPGPSTRVGIDLPCRTLARPSSPKMGRCYRLPTRRIYRTSYRPM